MMEPIDYRNETWESLQTRLTGIRMAVWEAWKRYGPGTTREVSASSSIDILTLRPRTTELYQMGFVELVEDPIAERQAPPHEGVYRAVSWLTAMQRFHKAKANATQRQLQLI
jgi:hypothetical protein